MKVCRHADCNDFDVLALAIRPAAALSTVPLDASDDEEDAAMQAVLISDGAMIYLSAVLEYMIAEVLELSGNVARDNRRAKVTRG